MSEPLGFTELIQRIGDDKVRFQNLMSSVTGVRMLKRQKATSVTFLTDAITATQVMNDTHGLVALVVWLPKVEVDRARAEHDAGAPLPANG